MLKRFLRGGDDQSLIGAERVMLVAIIGILITLLASQIAHTRAMNRDNARKADLYSIQLSLQKFFALNGYYPTSISQLSDLSPSACADPSRGGNCQQPAYSYLPFASGTKPSVNLATNCDNKKSSCASYVLYSSHMETTANPYVLTSL